MNELVKLLSSHDYYFLDSNYNKRNQMYYDVLSNESSVIFMFFIQCSMFAQLLPEPFKNK